jgi:Asp-tRNA(Asn)/Glu-tRNA(Gln) amidotransferase A subunit family amidase
MFGRAVSIRGAGFRAGLRQLGFLTFEDFDALLCPVAPVSAPPLDERPVHRRSLVTDGRRQRGVEGYLKLTAWNSLASSAYLPATVAPVGFTSECLPVGFQIIAGHLEDSTAISIASHLEAMNPDEWSTPERHRRSHLIRRARHRAVCPAWSQP